MSNRGNANILNGHGQTLAVLPVHYILQEHCKAKIYNSGYSSTVIPSTTIIGHKNLD